MDMCLGYVTCSSLSDEETVGVNGDDERDSLYSINNENREGRKEKRLHPAICPHCNFIYEKVSFTIIQLDTDRY